jgi:D-alanyl-D-alanine carboxypeptidase/D-alanyl-D-alanine-endopeptidase (penicillin-binding protein 4)
LPWYYAAPTAAFAIGEAATTMIVASTSQKAEVSLPDAVEFAPVVNRVVMDTAGARRNVDVSYEAWPAQLVVTGTMPPNSADTSYLAQPDPDMYAAKTLVAVLKRKGINVTGTTRVLRDSASLRTFADAHNVFSIASPPVREIIGGLLKPSQNWIAEQLLKTVGAVKGNNGSWRRGLQTERRFLIDVVHIDSTQFSLSDGSGLSAQNIVSPHAFVMLLEYARTQPWGTQYYDALPKPGMRGGTLSSRLQGLETRLAAKTGSIANVNSLSGYVTTVNGRGMTFSIVTNSAGRPSAEIRRAMDKIVQALAAETIQDD